MLPRSASPARDYTYLRHTFSRSYGIILPSSFSRVLSSTLEFSSYPPVSVWGTATINLKLRGFSWKQGINHFRVSEDTLRHHASGLTSRICLANLPTRLNQLFQQLADLAFSVTPSQLIPVQEY